MQIKRIKWGIILLAATMLTSCSTTPSPTGSAAVQGGTTTKSVSQNSSSPNGTYVAPPFADSVYDPQQAVGQNGVLVDYSQSASGYIGVSAQSDKRLKFKIIKDGVSYIYDLPGDGTQTIYPLSMGSGAYEFKAMQNTRESLYAPICELSADVQLNSEFEPFLRPNQFANYNENSECVKKAAEFASKANTDAEVVAAVYAHIKNNIKYDNEKAASLKSTYLPVPDETLATNMGICFDYASLAAAMLRSQGIPTKLIEGKVAPNDITHAWNMIWLKDKGWVEAKFEVPAKTWQRIDLTFAAGGANASFVGDGTNYTQMFEY